jgi:predicted MFS family arabinose efflux permease
MNKATTQPANYRWVMLLTAATTSMLVFGIPVLSLPPLFSEIAADLNLNIVQIGWIWGISSITGMFVVLIGGSIGDRFGTRNTLIIICFLTGILGALRGLSVNFTTFLLTSLLLGLVQPAITVNLHKVAGQWFPRQQLGLATGVVSAGFAMGLMLGSLFSATVFSPALGGWRNVLYLYGGVSILMSLAWFFIHPHDDPAAQQARRAVPFREALGHVARLRHVWMIGLGVLFFWACVRGFVGYLPLYLREIGWEASTADRVLGVYYGVSLLAAIPIALLSDRFGIRRGYLIFAALATATGVSLFSIAEGLLVWGAIIMAGVVFDAFMAIYQTAVMEGEGVGGTYAGTALGFAGMMREAGGVFSPPLGNSLTVFGLNTPFLFWGAMGLLAMTMFVLVPVKKKVPLSPVPEP